MNPITSIREFNPEDIAFIKSSWLKNQCNTVPFKFMKNFFISYSPLLDKRIPTIKILIACNPEYADQTYGYVAYDKDVLHFIYVKGVYRHFGLSKDMLQAAFPEAPPKYYSHLSDNQYFKTLMWKNKISYNPLVFIGE